MTERTGATDGRRLGGRYRMGELLASGGMGEVWAAHDLLLDRPVAVKVLGGALAGDGRAAERLRREARAAGRLEHPSIARVLDLGEHDGRPYLVMELLEGESLATRIDRAGPMPPDEAARVVAAVADALKAAHAAGVVHRDVKPGNVFLTSTGEVKVLDFGIAWCAHDAALTTGELLGTAAYLAPERVLGHRATPAADIYALGVVLYELLAGHRPFDADSEVELAMAHVNANPPSLREAAPSAPPFLIAAAHQAMAKDPSARPPSAAAFANLVQPPPPGSATTQPLRVAANASTQPLQVAAAHVITHPFRVAAAHAITRPGLPPAHATGSLSLPASAGAPIPVPGFIPDSAPTSVQASTSASAPIRVPGSVPRTNAAVPAPPVRSGPRPRSRGRRGLLVALLLAGALLAALPALAGGLSLVRERVDGPLAVLEPGSAAPSDGASQEPSATDATADPGAQPADDPGPPASSDPGAKDNRRSDGGGDRDRDDDSSGSGRSGGDSGGGGSSGPG
ncbi:MAG: protein kinase [Actinomycetes bacterium]